jgi:hypothetical protein
MTNAGAGAEGREVKVPTFGANGFRESAMMYDGGGWELFEEKRIGQREVLPCRVYQFGT